MTFFSNKDGGLMDVIRCDEQDYLIWKWHPQGTSSKTSDRSNSIRWGSSLRVRESSVAVFVYSQENGTTEDYIEGPFDGIIETKNFPVLANIVGLAYAGGSPFQAEIYFINLANLIQIKFGVPYFDIFDPRFLDYGVPVAVRGSINFKISDYREFIKLHRMDEFDMAMFQTQVKDSITRHVKDVVSNAPDKHGIPVVQIERQISQINALVKSELSENLRKDFGVSIKRVDISDIEIDKNSSGYKKLESLTQNKASVFVHGAASIVDTVSTHRAGAKKIKNSVKDDESKGIDIGAVGKKVSNKIGNVLSGRKKGTPPPLPTGEFFVGINGEQKGPFDISKLKEMVSDGEITTDTLVWKDGMDDWERAETVEVLRSLFQTS